MTTSASNRRRERAERPLFFIDTVENVPDENVVILNGWGFDPASRSPLEIVDVNGKPADWRATTRNDVNAVHGLAEGRRFGLTLRLDRSVGGRSCAIRVRPVDRPDAVTTVRLGRSSLSERSVSRQLSTWTSIARTQGIIPLARHLAYRAFKTKSYPTWIKKNERYDPATVQETIADFPIKPLISIVTPVYNVDERYFEAFVASIRNQYYPHWELCLADDASTAPHVRPMLERAAASDPRIRVIFREENGHISQATNSAIDMATGDFVAFADNDDELAPHALFENVRAINADPRIDFLYSDEDKITQAGRRVEPFFKPNWNKELLYGHNYITHFVMVARGLLQKVGPLRPQFDGAQDYDFVLRATEHATTIHHIPAILYHWRMVESSTASDPESKLYAFEAGRAALQDAFTRQGIQVEIGIDTTYFGAYNVRYPLRATPLVSVIVVGGTKRGRGLWMKNLKYQDYPHTELIVTKDLAEAVRSAKGTYILFGFDGLTSRNKRRTPNTAWLSDLVSMIQRPGIGAVTGKVASMDNQTVTAGLSLNGAKLKWIHDDKGANKDTIGTFFRIWLPRYVGAATLDLTMMSREDALRFAEDLSLPSPSNGVELTVDIRVRLGKPTVFRPTATLYALWTPVGRATPAMKRQLNSKYPDQRDLDPYATFIGV